MLHEQELHDYWSASYHFRHSPHLLVVNAMKTQLDDLSSATQSSRLKSAIQKSLSNPGGKPDLRVV